MLSQITFTPAAGSAVTLHAATGNFQVGVAEGVFGPPATRDVARSNAGFDGTLDDTHLFDERKITFDGSVIGSSISNAVSNFETLTAAFATSLITPGTLTITLADGTTQRWCKVILADAVQPSVSGGAALIDYQVSFRAPDPRWYGITLRSSTSTIATTTAATSSSQSVTNAGTAPTFPKFEWTAGTGRVLSDVTVTVPTAYLSVSPQGSTIVLDASGTATPLALNDYIDCTTRTTNTLSTLSATTEWPVLYPGSSSWTWTQQLSGGSSSSSTCTMTYYDAWW